MTTKQIINKHNEKLMLGLIPDKSTPIFGRSMVDLNDEIFNKPLIK